MWYVYNKTNGIILEKYKNKLIIPFFESLVSGKKLGYVNYIDYISNKKIDKETRKILKYAYDRKNRGEKAGDIIENIFQCYGLAEIKHYYYIYLLQNKQLKDKKDVSYETIPDLWVDLFKTFFYKKFFELPKLWELVGEPSFSRQVFHENFKNDNNILVCPYCDIDTLNDGGNDEIEHFWPESIFPFLSVSALNLFSCCHSCNCVAKKARWIVPITMPSYEQIGDLVRFNLDIAKRKISISSDKTRVVNYLQLINLPERYSKRSIYLNVENKFISVYESIKCMETITGKRISEQEAKAYVTRKKDVERKIAPLTFAMSSLFDKYDVYSDFVKNLDGD